MGENNDAEQEREEKHNSLRSRFEFNGRDSNSVLASPLSRLDKYATPSSSRFPHCLGTHWQVNILILCPHRPIHHGTEQQQNEHLPHTMPANARTTRETGRHTAMRNIFTLPFLLESLLPSALSSSRRRKLLRCFFSAPIVALIEEATVELYL